MTNTVAELTALSRRDKIRDKIFIAMQPVVEMIHTTRQLGLYNIKNNKQHKLYYCHKMWLFCIKFGNLILRKIIKNLLPSDVRF